APAPKCLEICQLQVVQPLAEEVEPLVANANLLAFTVENENSPTTLNGNNHVR
ncbi:MAG: putative membrane protein YkgB, partial [Halioglobus sp.]